MSGYADRALRGISLTGVMVRNEGDSRPDGQQETKRRDRLRNRTQTNYPHRVDPNLQRKNDLCNQVGRLPIHDYVT